MSQFTKYFSEEDVQLFSSWSFDMGEALVVIGEKENMPELVQRGLRMDEDLWHFRATERSGIDKTADKKTMADELMNGKESRAARVAALAGAYERMEELEVSPFDWGMKEVV
jgi:hypothetical protein